ncbi:MAG: glutathione peroxidase [Pseudomonadota bacterium]
MRKAAVVALMTLVAACGAETIVAAGSDGSQTTPILAVKQTAAPETKRAEGTPNMTETDSLLYKLDLETIEGKPLPFETFRGKAVLVVNTASRCGYTGQYAGLQELWVTYQDKGLVVMGVPSNDFGGQEPGSEEQVKSFCEINYGVDFPLTSKTAVVGTDRHPLYAGLEDALGLAARPKWNFHKVLIGADGVPMQAFPSNVTPSDPVLMKAIEAALPR